jgi:type I restriction enzyme S subunit
MSERAKPAWSKIPLGKLAKKLVNGGTPPTDVARFWNGRIPWVTGADFTLSGIGEFRRFVSEEAISQTATNMIERGQLLIVTRTGVGKLAIAPCNIAISQDITGFCVDENQATPEFLYHRMRRGVEDLKKLNQGTSINGIIRADLENYPVELPPLPQQRRIAEILSTADEAMEQTEALIAKYQQIKAGLMHDLFTRGVTAAGQLRPTRQEAPQLYKEEPRFGWTPNEWQPENFGDKIELVHGYQFRDFDFVEDGIPVVKIGQVTEDGLDLSTCSFVSRDRLNSFQEIQIKQGDVLMALTGATLGKTCIVEETNTDLLQNYRVGRFEPRKPETVHKGFLFALLGFSKIRRQIFDKVNSGAQGNVGKADFERVRICLPSYDEQVLIHEVFDALQRKIKTEQSVAAKLRAQKHGLMQDLLTGRVPMRVAEPATTKD